MSSKFALGYITASHFLFPFLLFLPCFNTFLFCITFFSFLFFLKFRGRVAIFNLYNNPPSKNLPNTCIKLIRVDWKNTLLVYLQETRFNDQKHTCNLNPLAQTMIYHQNKNHILTEIFTSIYLFFFLAFNCRMMWFLQEIEEKYMNWFILLSDKEIITHLIQFSISNINDWMSI